MKCDREKGNKHSQQFFPSSRENFLVWHLAQDSRCQGGDGPHGPAQFQVMSDIAPCDLNT